MDDLQTSAAPPEEEKMSFVDKLVNVLASPGEVFEYVRRTPITHSNWLIPTLILAIVGSLLGYAVMANPSLADQFKRISSEQMEKQLQKQINQGKLTPEQADQAREQGEKFGSIGVIVSILAKDAIGPFFFLFVLGLVYWLLGKGIMKADVSYWKVVEVIGLVESIVTTILMFLTDRVTASPSLALFISDFSIDNKWHMLAAIINIFTFWNLGVVSVGLSRIFQRDFPKVLVLLVALWAIWSLAMIFGLAALRG
jgi:hypothetical protein